MRPLSHIVEEQTIPPDVAEELAQRLAPFEGAGSLPSALGRPLNKMHKVSLELLTLPKKRALYVYGQVAKNAVLATNGFPHDALTRFKERETDVLLLRNCLPEETLQAAVQSPQQKPAFIVGSKVEAAAVGLHAIIEPFYQHAATYVLGTVGDGNHPLHTDSESGCPIVLLLVNASPDCPVKTVFSYCTEEEGRQKNPSLCEVHPQFALRKGDALFFHEHTYVDPQSKVIRALMHAVTGKGDQLRYGTRVQAPGERSFIPPLEKKVYEQPVSEEEFYHYYKPEACAQA
jgi:hypothetical protein